ncbi:MAG: acetyl-CoA decarbonylase/synthase complex subunit delta [Chloroflexi bacterium]|jgi:acetyl-CoA decarbonylase/synthase complex subunit delta|nr:acetyl-CoA decarbonylase/synthase complex subunit delta [Chloroflexota bacterium]
MATPVPVAKETWTGKIREITLGATPAQGGTRGSTVTIGGENTLPFLHFEGQIPRRPAVAVEILDQAPDDWSPVLTDAWGDVVHDVGAWAKKAEEIGADLIALTLESAHPERGNTDAAHARKTVRTVLQATSLPLIIYGPGQAEKDNEVLVAAAEEAAGERVALGCCEDKNYRTIVAAALAHNQLVVARSPIDVNLGKQLNILISDMRMDLDRILMDPTTGALGYGLEYTYSVMERLRLAALTGDSVIQQPMIVTVGYEAWRSKESRTGEGVPAAWGDWGRRARLWETMTATALLEAGANVVVLRHPAAVKVIKQTIEHLSTAS